MSTNHYVVGASAAPSDMKVAQPSLLSIAENNPIGLENRRWRRKDGPVVAHRGLALECAKLPLS
jgi:hypothetical protein